MNNKQMDIEKILKEELEQQEVPEHLSPEAMQKRLEEATGQQPRAKRTVWKKRRWMIPAVTAACMVLVVGGSLAVLQLSPSRDNGANEEGSSRPKYNHTQKEIRVDLETKPASDAAMYDAIYAHLKEAKEHQDIYYDIDNDGLVQVRKYSDFNLSSLFDGLEKGDAMANGAIPESEMDIVATTNGSANKEFSYTSEDSGRSDDFSETNVQVATVDEADVVKNDGRYLYQTVGEDYNYDAVQIVDTQDGLKEVGRVKGFNSIREFYVSGDTLVVIDTGWMVVEAPQSEVVTDAVYHKCYDGYERSYSELHFYDISEKNKPRKIHSFTFAGDYQSSRISDGYLYFFGNYGVNSIEDQGKFEDYIPVLEGELLTNDSLYLPEETDTSNYLVMCSINMEDPTAYTDKMAVLSNGELFYVSERNIYVVDSCYDMLAGELSAGVRTNRSTVSKFSYDRGQIEAVAETIVSGLVLDQFAMDEYDGNFRMVTTVTSCELTKVTDSLFGMEMGYSYKDMPTTNSVYVMDEALNVIGTIEDLAEYERVYSARFMGEMGYFVTFRQTDPLFSVDFSDPTNPQILGELKITGFSEYLHFYSEDLLLGIGYEADEKTGWTECMKISMFDISDPTNVQEINKLILEDYHYSDALYNHKAVLVEPEKNIIGFQAESGRDGEEYCVFSYDENEGFAQKYSVSCEVRDKYQVVKQRWRDARGTYIGDTLYVMKHEGGVSAHGLYDGELLEALETDK